MKAPQSHTPPKKKLPPWQKHVTVAGLMALMGTNFEIATRTQSLLGYEALKLKPLSLAGWTSLWMLPVYGLAGLALGQLNEHKKIRRLPMICQCLLGLFIALGVELVSGYVLNIKLGLALWDYSQQTFQFAGQIGLVGAGYFFLVSPFVFWADDLVRYVVSDDAEKRRERPKLLAYYGDLFRLRPHRVKAGE